MSETTQRSAIPEAHLPGSDVLIYSSDKRFIHHHRAILLSIGFAPIAVTTLEAALAALRVMVIELVIVDEEAGAVETQTVLKRAKDDGQNIPVLVVSQSSEGELRQQALDLGAAGYLDRPAFQDDVVRALLAHCSRGGNPSWGPLPN